MTTEPLRRRDWPTAAGLLVVAIAAAILTFTTLRDLAEAVGITGDFLGLPLAWLLPLTVDAAGVVAARVWLRGIGGGRAVPFARTLACCCIGLSVGGNAAQHAMAAYLVAPPWWVVVLVTAVPPAMLGAVVHLGHRLRDEPAAMTFRPLERHDLGAVLAPLVTAAPDRPTGSDPGPDPDADQSDPSADRAPTGVLHGDDALAALLTEWAQDEGAMPSRDRIRVRYGIGSRRADRVRTLAVRRPTEEEAS